MMKKCSKKICGTKKNGEDRLSRLPDSVLVRILSFLPARHAVRTVLLRAFGDVWTTIDALEFDDSLFPCEFQKPYASLKFVRFVSHFLMLHRCSKITKFRVRFSNSYDYIVNQFSAKCSERELVTEIEMWIRFALSRGVEVLDLEFSSSYVYGEKMFQFPCYTWINDSIVELRLHSFQIRNLDKVQSACLRVLKLNRVSIRNEVLSKIICGCPALQHMDIADCSDLNSLSFMAPKVETLRLGIQNYEWKVLVECPNVKSFQFSGLVQRVEIVNLSSVKTASFSLKWYDKCDWEYKVFHHFKRFLDRMQHVHTMTFSFKSFSVLAYRVMNNHPCPRNKWKRVVVHTAVNENYISGLCSLLRSSSYLEEIVLQVEDLDDYPNHDILSKLCKTEVMGVNNWSSQCLTQNLKVFTMHGLFRTSYVAQVDLVEAILLDALVLDKLIIYTKSDQRTLEEDVLTGQELFEISKQLLTFPRASKRASVFLV